VGLTLVRPHSSLSEASAIVLGGWNADHLYGVLLACFPLWLLSAAIFTPAFRGRVHRWLGELTSSTRTQEAAAVASLIGQQDGGAAAALRVATKAFRALPVESLTLEELQDNKPDPLLFNKTERADLGSVAAFCSHSWSDDGTAKHERLNEYSSKHQEEGGGGPCLIWLDKACIDQQNIQASLAALPIFLSGCNHLLILAGPTYCTRLWCVMEVFVFLKMGGRQESLIVKLLNNENALHRLLEGFEAGKARCFLDADRHHLLAVIETGFGSFAPFNAIVRRVFAQKIEHADNDKVNAASSTKYTQVELFRDAL